MNAKTLMKYNIKNLFNNKIIIQVYSILFLAVLASIFSAKEQFNFFINIYENLTNETSNIIVMILLIIISIKYIKNRIHINILLREKKQDKLITKIIKEIIIINLYILIHYVILIIAGGIFISYNDFTLIKIYNTNPIILIILKITTNFTIFIAIVIITILIYLINNKIRFLIIFIPFLQSIPTLFNKIDNVIKMPLNPFTHLTSIRYNNLILNISCSILEILLLIWIIKILIKIYNKKKREQI